MLLCRGKNITSLIQSTKKPDFTEYQSSLCLIFGYFIKLLYNGFGAANSWQKNTSYNLNFSCRMKVCQKHLASTKVFGHTRNGSLLIMNKKIEVKHNNNKNTKTKQQFSVSSVCVSRNLADVSNDNVLNVEEFVLAMHLIRKVSSGLSVPRSLPKHLVIGTAAPPVIEDISDRENEAYRNVFNKISQSQINGKLEKTNTK